MPSKFFSLKTAIMIGIFSLAGGIFSIAYAQSATDIASNVTALIVAIGSVMGAIAAIATSVVGIIRSKTGDKIISDKAYNDISKVSASLIDTDYWIQENQQRMTGMVSAIATLSPEAKKSLEDNGLNIQALTTELNGLSNDLQRAHAMLPRNPTPNQ